ncbi:MAG: hypothetical protein ACUVQR_04020 [Thermogutta sp.]
MWNSYLNFGAPLAAENSCAAFYPGMLILALPMPFHRCYLIFLLIHLSLAAWGILRLARQCGVTGWAASLAAISYPFSGYVLFQIYNPIFLTSAAWLPWVIEALFSLVFQKDPQCQGSILDVAATDERSGFSQMVISLFGHNAAALRFGVLLALMVLGGDPQTAYHCVLLALVTWVATIIGAAKRRLGGDRSHSRLRTSISLGIPLAVVILTGFLLAAVQIIPTLAYTSVSERALLKSLTHDAAESAGQKAKDNHEGGSISALVNAAIARQRSHWHRVIYDFSTPAYRWIEFLWPNFGGRPLPFNTHWIAAIFPEGRWWTPSLYMGLFPFLLALSSLRFWSGKRNSASADLGWEGQTGRKARELNELYLQRIQVWFSWVSVFSLVAALGWYGPAGVWEALRGGAADQAAVTDVLPPVGGVYWLLTCILPGYRFFRYPSKWLVLTSLGFSMLSALALDRVDKRMMRRLVHVMMALLIAFIVLLVVFFVASPLWDYAQRNVPPDPVFGRFQAEQARWETLSGLAIVGGMIALWLGIIGRLPPRAWPVFIVGLTALDLAINNAWMIFPVNVPGEPLCLANRQPPRRFWRRWCDYPKGWLEPSSTRIKELHDWERETSAVRWGMVTGNVPLQSYGTFIPADYYVFLALLHEFMYRHGLTEPPPETLALLGALPVNHRHDLGAVESDPASSQAPNDQSRYCFFSHHYKELNSTGLAQSNVWQLTESVFFPDGRPRSFSEPLLVETARRFDSRLLRESCPRSEEMIATVDEEYCQTRKFQPGHVVVEAALTKPGIVVLAEQFLPGWRVRVLSEDHSHSRTTSPLRINRVMMGVALPPGKWEITWIYHDPGLAPGAAISGVAWLAVIALTWLRLVRHEQKRFPRR